MNLLKYMLILIISFLSWNYFGLLFLINIYFFFQHIDNIKLSSNFKTYFFKTYIIMLLWHLGAVGWLLNVDQGLYAILANSIIYTIPFIIMFKLIIKNNLQLYLFIPLWLLFEWSINTYSYSTPLITIGNSLSNQIYIIQWFKYLNVLSGSFWMLIIAYFIFIKKIKWAILTTIIPIIFSLIIFLTADNNTSNSSKTFNVLVFNPKHYQEENNDQNILTYLNSNLKKVRNLDFLIIPEATINFKLTSYKNTSEYKLIKNLINNIPQILIGVDIAYHNNSKINASILLSEKESLLKVKKKLVPFTENAPNFMKKFYNKSFYISNIKDDTNKIKEKNNFAPLICYEIFFPFYVNKIAKNMKLCIVTASEQFLNNSYYGEKFYNNILRLRAIENRQMFLKCSNFGNSIIINKKGIIIDDSKNKEFYTFNLPTSLFNKY